MNIERHWDALSFTGIAFGGTMSSNAIVYHCEAQSATYSVHLSVARLARVL